MEIEILEDWGDVVAVNKQAGWLTIPGRGETSKDPVLSDQLGRQLRGGRSRGPDEKSDLYIVHRLDKGTSGVVLFTRNSDSHRLLSGLFETREVEKYYWCLVKGAPHSQMIDAPIYKLPSKKIRSVVSPKGKPSQTQIKVLNTFENYSVVEAKPLTGRSHQIRVHLSHIGFPLLGDPLYGGIEELFGSPLTHPLLHARSLTFPWKGAKMTATAPLSGAFADIAKSLGFGPSC